MKNTIVSNIKKQGFITAGELETGVLAETEDGFFVYKDEWGNLCLLGNLGDGWRKDNHSIKVRILPKGTKITVELEQE